MENKEIKVVLDHGAYMPEHAHAADAGYDLKTPVFFELKPNSSAVIDTGVHMAIPNGYAGLIVSKSGLNIKKGITCRGLVDSGYTGSIVVKLYNHTNKLYAFEPGDKITQIVIIPVLTPQLVEADSLDKTERGDAGFGSTGV